MKILIGTLYSGESQYSFQQVTLHNQTKTDWKQEIIEGLGEKEAHKRLYEYFISNDRFFDIFLKLDADMVFNKKNALFFIEKVFKNNVNLQHAIFPVLDWFSRKNIEGLHAYSKGCNWHIPPEEDLFVDPYPSIEGKRLFFKNFPVPFINHAPFPTEKEAFYFGLHRASKIVQLGTFEKNPNQLALQGGILSEVWGNFKETSDKRLAMALAGCYWMLEGKKYLHEGISFDEFGKKGYEEFSLKEDSELISEIFKIFSKNYLSKNNLEKKIESFGNYDIKVTKNKSFY